MHIDIFSDTVCPWCYIGKQRLERALARRPQEAPTHPWRAFQPKTGRVIVTRTGRHVLGVLRPKDYAIGERILGRLVALGEEWGDGVSHDDDITVVVIKRV